MQKYFGALFVAVLAVGFVPTASAESRFTHHLDLFQVTTHNRNPKTLEFGYHFSTVRVAERVELFGAGGGLDFYPDGKAQYGDSYWKGSPFLIGHIVGVQLGRPEDAYDGAGISLGANYIYHVRYHEHRISVGFSITWDAKP
jgi:hypothetical protein